MKRNIYQKMSAVMADATKIPKNGWNSHGKYKYVQAVDAINSISKLLVEHGICFQVSDNLVERNIPTGKQIQSHIRCKAIFTNVDSPEEKIEVEYSSISADMSDKDIFKAKTNGLKYLFTQMFLLVTDDVRDTEESLPSQKIKQPPTENKIPTYNAIMSHMRLETNEWADKDKLQELLTEIGVENSAQLKEKPLKELNIILGNLTK